jgi:hypothetical protein
MSREDLAATCVYDYGEWVLLPEDPTSGDLRANGYGIWTPEWYEALGYDPRPHIFCTPAGVSVEVHKQDDDSDDVPYTFLFLLVWQGQDTRCTRQPRPALSA